jgi:hypothetical protein
MSFFAEWNETIFRIKQVPKESQRLLKLTSEELLSCMIEFCKFYNRKYKKYGDKSNLNYAIQLLEHTKENPKKFRECSQLFNQAVADIKSGLLMSKFDWNAEQ